MKVTVDKLQDKGACPDQVCIFEKEWPKGCTISPKVLKRAIELGLDLDWFADSFLFGPARNSYWDAENSAGDAWSIATDEPLAAYYEARRKHRASRQLKKIYEAADVKAEKIFNTARVKALWKALKS